MKEISYSKDIKDIPSTNYSKTKNQTTIMIRNNLCVINVDIWKVLFKIRNIRNCINILIFSNPVSNTPIWGKVRVY